MPISFFARGENSTNSNGTLKPVNTNSTPTTELTFQAAAGGGDEILEFNGGDEDPDTVVIVDGQEYTFTVVMTGNLPTSNKLDDVNGEDLQGEEIMVVTLSNGDQYFFLTNGTTSSETMDYFPNGNISLDNFVICFVAGTMIRTPNGEVPVDALQVGDLVTTADGRDVPIRWVGERRISRSQLRVEPALAPVCIPAHHFGHARPERDLLVSPLHRVLLRDPTLEHLFGEAEMFAAARDIRGAQPVATSSVRYIHFLCDAHEVVIANGLESESLFPGEVAMMALTKAQRVAAMNAISGSTNVQRSVTARPCLTRKEARVFQSMVTSKSDVHRESESA